MAYVPYTWADGEEGGTPITAERLNSLEQGIAEVELLEGPEGPEGPQGPQGEAGPAGSDGSDGSDGFPTEAQWDDLVARVAALESADAEG
ncbi:hypothetical protein JOF45_000415 [Nesterenkonia lacusekhoensis]|uniref:Collagen-like protein n=1 Tax=Nesterenkonia lacusekhoensis TaxID=150832 RepID=A0ABS4T2A1_9MICC|nr:hypothetical protein [Nesterenkonia lacusekhoensis]